jgi:hypothetical protein
MFAASRISGQAVAHGAIEKRLEIGVHVVGQPLAYPNRQNTL